MSLRPLSAIVASGFAIMGLATPALACKLVKVGSLDMAIERNKPLINGKINGSPVRILLDTGAFATSVWRSTAKEHDLRILTASGFEIEGVGGKVPPRFTTIRELEIGDNKAKNVRTLLVDGATGTKPFSDVILGANFLEQFDIELNYKDNHINFFKPNKCDENPLNYWSQNVYMAEMSRRKNAIGGQHIVFDVKVNGKPMRAMLDTGATVSSISASAARQFGMDSANPNIQEASYVIGVGSKKKKSWIGTFDSFEIGAITVKNSKLRIIEKSPKWWDIVLGSDFIQSHRILVSYSQQLVYFQYLGGPIFNVFIDEPLEDEDGDEEGLQPGDEG